MADWILQNLLGLIALLTGIGGAVLAWNKKSGIQEDQFTAMREGIKTLHGRVDTISEDIIRLANTTPAHIQSQLTRLEDAIEGMREEQRAMSKEFTDGQKELLLTVIEQLKR